MDSRVTPRQSRSDRRLRPSPGIAFSANAEGPAACRLPPQARRNLICLIFVLAYTRGGRIGESVSVHWHGKSMSPIGAVISTVGVDLVGLERADG
ncbi:hypothetical protein ACH4TX_40240 [Streptomyces sp. NPDC021098]|uniref:hypothetical protein n=1 Tax=unclassified Streptomyces TaxID=2593676 RepID=UPI0037A8A923